MLPAANAAQEAGHRSPTTTDENPFEAFGRGWRTPDPEDIAKRAVLRPLEVVLASDDSPPEWNYAKVVIEKLDAHPANGKDAARAAVGLMNERLERGLSLDVVFDCPAFGGNQIASRTGLDPKTGRSWLAEVFGAPVGQLPHWTDPSNGDLKNGAFRYHVTVVFHHFGDYVDRAMKLIEAAPDHLRDGLRAVLLGATLLKGSATERRLEGCLEGVLKRAKLGNRNALGHWLTRRCIDVGLTEGEAQHWIERFWESVRWMGGHEYKWREATATLRSAYRRCHTCPK